MAKGGRDIIVARVSQGMGHFRTLWVVDETLDGWVYGVEEGDVAKARREGFWISPDNIVHRAPAHAHFGYNDIAPGTLVKALGVTGFVVERKGASYDVMAQGELVSVTWREVVPIPCDEPGA